MQDSTQGLDALVGGCRGWFYMMLSLMLGALYFGLLITGFAVALGLSIVWVGLPMLLFLFAATRRVAALDRAVTAMILNTQADTLADDLNLQGGGVFQRLSAYTTSASTWQRIIYLFMKLPLGATAFTFAMILTPFLALETLLALLGINFGLITPRITRALAIGLSGTAFLPSAAEVMTTTTTTKPQTTTTTRKPRQPEVEIPVAAEKRKRATQRLRLEEDASSAPPLEGDGYGYYLDDDGEIAPKRKRR